MNMNLERATLVGLVLCVLAIYYLYVEMKKLKTQAQPVPSVVIPSAPQQVVDAPACEAKKPVPVAVPEKKEE